MRYLQYEGKKRKVYTDLYCSLDVVSSSDQEKLTRRLARRQRYIYDSWQVVDSVKNLTGNTIAGATR